MSNIIRTPLVSAVIAPLVLAASALAQDGPVRTITEIADGVYRATDNNHGTVFMVTDDGIVLADPINPDFAKSLEEMQQSIEIPVHSHWNGYSWLDMNVLGMYHFLTD